MTTIVAIFDLEGTLCQAGQIIWRELIRKCTSQPGGIFRVAIYIVQQMVLNYLRKLHLANEYKVRAKAITGMTTLLSGTSIAEMNEFAEFIAGQLSTVWRDDMVAVLKKHQQEGHLVLLTSSLFTPLLAAVGSKLGVNTILGTGLQMKNSRYTGKVSPPVCFDKQRVAMINEFIQEKGLTVDFKQSYAYGDSKWDQVVLEMVGNPVAAYPEETLRTYAQSQGWQIIG